MSNVTHIRAGHAPVEIVPIEDDLVEFARKVTDGECSAYRGVLVYESRDGYIRHIAIGDAISKIEAVGMLNWAADNVKNAEA